MKRPFYILLPLIFLTTLAFGQDPYEKLWKAVEKLETDGLTQSALEQVNAIATKAEKDQNTVQLVKSLLYKSKYALVLEEDAQLSIINDFKTRIAKSQAPERNIYQNLLANLYWQYFQENRYRFYDRTHTEVADTEDFRTWDLQTLFDEVHKQFQASLSGQLVLQQTPLKDYDALLITQESSKLYRPTLFDFLSHNALQFYKTDENSITQPANKFLVDNPDYLCDATKFAHLEIKTEDVASLQFQALKLYKQLTAFHLKNNTPEALADVNIQRLKFVSEHATFENGETLLLETLEAEKDALKNSEIAALYDFEIARVYAEQGFRYSTEAPDNRWKLKEALAICYQVIAQFPESRAATNCKILKTRIEAQALAIQTETYTPLLQAGKMLVTYRNIDRLTINLYALNSSQITKLKGLRKQEDIEAFAKPLKATKSFNSTLRDEGDYQSHSTEVVLPSLANGYYFTTATTEDGTIFSYSKLQFTNLAVVKTENGKTTSFQAINRNNGAALRGAKIIATYDVGYNGKSDSQTLTTDELGKVSLSKMGNNMRNLHLEVHYGDEVAYFGNYYVGRYYDDSDYYERERAFLFTDRSIYRPGQTVHFKAIAVKTESLKTQVMADKILTATLYDVNSQELSKVSMITNAYGSVAGNFVLPSGGLTGDFSIDIRDAKGAHLSSQSFSVEEYKRPKFETHFEPVTETYKVNDSVSVTGTAMAYAGSVISNAKVSYRVQRKVQFPDWYYWFRPAYHGNSQEITFGETETDSKGQYVINFKAIPDETVKAKDLPVFYYEITADVTDVNGETRSSKTTVKVGYHALTAKILVSERLDNTQKDHSLELDTKNLNGEFVPASGTLHVYKLQAPESVLRPRPWEAPDYQTLSKEEFSKLFPHDPYTHEGNSLYWPKGKAVFTANFDTKTSKEVALGNMKNWEEGLYLIELKSTDKFGQEVKDQQRVTVFDPKSKAVVDNALFSATYNKASYQLEDTAILTLASAAEDVLVFVDVEKGKRIVDSYQIKLSNSIKSVQIPVTKGDVGGFTVHVNYAAYNHFDYQALPVIVPYPKSELEIETQTFRDKLQPGQDETWKFKIKGPKGDAVTAELLASMYDASLDQFRPHAWSFNPLHQPTYYSRLNRDAGNSFGTSGFRTYLPRALYYGYTTPSYDDWNWFGLYFGNYREYRRNFYSNKPSYYTSEKNSSIETGIVKGIVNDENGLPLPGVNIIKDNSKKDGTQTDFDGLFSISAKENDNLTFSYVGYKTLSIKISEENYLIVTLTPDSNAIEEVVLTALAIKRGPDEITTANQVMDSAEKNEVSFIRGSGNFNDGDSIGYNFASNKIKLIDKVDEGKNILIRKNLEETAFFFPQLETDAAGHVSFSFTAPEALTQWNLQLLAHTKNLESRVKALETVTQKELMVLPNAPRFLRHGDQIVISSKISNLSDKTLSGTTELKLEDAITGQDITRELLSSLPLGEMAKPERAFSVDSKGNTQTSWTLQIPETVDAVQYTIIAKAGNFSDGEQNALPVLSNRMLVTETLPMWIRSNETRTFSLDKLKQVSSSTLKHHKLTLEMTSNPAWYAVQSLPYLMEYPYDCNEQTFSRYYANALASHIANSNPRIKGVFEQWKNSDALLSNLEKNQELKSLLIQETPWLRDAQSESEQKKRIGLLFDLNTMSNQLQTALRKLEQNQLDNGAWAWFEGGLPNRYISQHIVTGFGHLKHLDVNSHNVMIETPMLTKALGYLDAEFVKEYKDLTKYNSKVDLSKDHLSYTQLHYLYMRSFFKDVPVSKDVQQVMEYYQSQIAAYWLDRPLYAKGLMALVSHRAGKTSVSKKIMQSLRETSINSEELGMYWKANKASWYWYQAPIETQALLIEAFSEIENDVATIDNLKIWLLKNKQTNKWETTKATTDAVYALLLQGSDWLSVDDAVTVLVGNAPIAPSKLQDVKVEAGTGYYKTSWNPEEISPQMADVTLTKTGSGIAWGSMYWQYFEDLDKITSAETLLKLKKKLYLKTNTSKGEQLSEVTETSNLQVGDLIRVRIELRSDRDMEFLHMKDMRAAGLEPVNVLSQYKWQDGLGYYESTKDAATNFFFDYLPKGVYVFEYDLRVNNAGTMSNGITTIQSMYAPEFSSHSEGVRIRVGQ